MQQFDWTRKNPMISSHGIFCALIKLLREQMQFPKSNSLTNCETAKFFSQRHRKYFIKHIIRSGAKNFFTRAFVARKYTTKKRACIVQTL
jgi:hypothetical protein